MDEIASSGTAKATVILNDREKARIAEDFSRTHREIQDLSTERKAINATLSEKRGHLAQLAEELEKGEREITVNVTNFWVNGSTVAVVRDDNGEELERRAPTQDERQIPLRIVQASE